MSLSNVFVNAVTKALAKSLAEKFSLDESAVTEHVKTTLASHFSSGSGRRRRGDTPAPKGKGRVSGYVLFSTEMRTQVQSENPGMPFGEMGKLLGTKWRELSAEKQGEWNERARTKNSENGFTPTPAPVATPAPAAPKAVKAAPVTKAAPVAKAVPAVASAAKPRTQVVKTAPKVVVRGKKPVKGGDSDEE